jgi:hypothetical protein
MTRMNADLDPGQVTADDAKKRPPLFGKGGQVRIKLTGKPIYFAGT